MQWGHHVAIVRRDGAATWLRDDAAHVHGTNAAMLTLHHLENSRSQRIAWLLEELGQPYEVRMHARDSASLRAPPALRAVHPLGKAPVLEHDGRVIAESGAIIDYLVDTFDSDRALSPASAAAGDPERMAYRYWLHYAEGSLMPPLLLTLVFSRIRSAPAPFFVRPVLRSVGDKGLRTVAGPQLALHLGHVEEALSRSPWFAGERFTAADIQMGYPLEAATLRAPADHPRIAAWLERVRARPAYQRAVERVGALQSIG